MVNSASTSFVTRTYARTPGKPVYRSGPGPLKKFYWLKMIYMSWNEFSMIRVSKWFQDGHLRKFWSWGIQIWRKDPQSPLGMKQNKFVLIFLIKNWPICKEDVATKCPGTECPETECPETECPGDRVPGRPSARGDWVPGETECPGDRVPGRPSARGDRVPGETECPGRLSARETECPWRIEFHFYSCARNV